MEQPSQAEAVETREDNQPFPFTFEHRWIALAQPRSTMFPMLSSPPPSRFQPADFSRNSKCDDPVSPSMDSMGSSSVCGSPDRRGVIPGELLGRSFVALSAMLTCWNSLRTLSAGCISSATSPR